MCLTHKNEIQKAVSLKWHTIEKMDFVFSSFVLLQVHLDMSENNSFSIGMEDLTTIKKFARETKKKNILVYGLLIQYKVCNYLSVCKLSSFATYMIDDRMFI